MTAIARRMQRIHAFQVMDILARARAMEAQGRHIVHMEVGEPDFTTPQPIIDAGIAALEAGKTHYTPAQGLPQLRQALSGHYRDRFGVDIDAGRLLITPGSSGALQLVLSVLVNPGQKVLMTDPGYPCNRHFVELVEGEPVALAVTAEHDYLPTLDQLEKAWDEATVALMLASPANPTGAVISRRQARDIHAFVRDRGGILVVDEIYQGLIYEGEAFSCLELGDDLVVINSFSKYFGMTGWRLGWAAMPQEMVEPMDRLAQNIFLSASTPAQHAALAAFSEATGAILQQRRDLFRQRRDYLLPALEQLGFRFPHRPEGAFYLYADCSAIAPDSAILCEELLQQVGVAVTPGSDFGQYEAKGHLRFAYTQPLEQLQLGVARIASHLGR